MKGNQTIQKKAAAIVKPAGKEVIKPPPQLTEAEEKFTDLLARIILNNVLKKRAS